jgi:hypothetical protein
MGDAQIGRDPMMAVSVAASTRLQVGPPRSAIGLARAMLLLVGAVLLAAAAGIGYLVIVRPPSLVCHNVYDHGGWVESCGGNQTWGIVLAAFLVIAGGGLLVVALVSVLRAKRN